MTLHVPCATCHGQGGRTNPAGGYIEFSGSYPVWEKCYACTGRGYVEEELVVLVPAPNQES